MVLRRFTEVIIKPTPESLGITQANDIAVAWDEYENWAAFDPELSAFGTKAVILNTGKYVAGVWNEGLTINFDVGKRADEEAETGEINIFNLSRDVLDTLVAGAEIELISGYEQYHSTIFIGVISEVHTFREEGDLRTRVKARGYGDLTVSLKSPGLQNLPNFIRLHHLQRCLTGNRPWDNNPTEYVGLDNYLQIEYYGFDDENHVLSLILGDNHNDKGEEGIPYRDVLNTFIAFVWTVVNRKLLIINVEDIYDEQLGEWTKKAAQLPQTAYFSYSTGLLSFQRSPKKDEKTLETVNEFEVKTILVAGIHPWAVVYIQSDITKKARPYVVKEVIYRSMDDEHICVFLAIPAEDWTFTTGAGELNEEDFE